MPRKRKTDVDDAEVKQKRGRKKGANGANGDHSASAVSFEDNEDDEESEIVSESVYLFYSKRSHSRYNNILLVFRYK